MFGEGGGVSDSPFDSTLQASIPPDAKNTPTGYIESLDFWLIY